MKTDKKKIVFGSIILCVITFIVAYSIYVFGDDEKNTKELVRPVVPKLTEEKDEYETRTEAIENLKENRPQVVPDLYDEEKINEEGSYDPDLPQKVKEHIVDSIINNGTANMTSQISKRMGNDSIDNNKSRFQHLSEPLKEEVDLVDERSLHQEFFLYNPQIFKGSSEGPSDLSFSAEVRGDQVVRNNDRLELTLMDSVSLEGRILLPNTRFYATVFLQPNRLVLKIPSIDGSKAAFEAFDLQDGQAGIYIENSLSAAVKQKVIAEAVEEIEVPGLPQLKGISNIFKKDNSKTKITVLNHYKLIIKPKS